jgi:hypothetical protein
MKLFITLLLNRISFIIMHSCAAFIVHVCYPYTDSTLIQMSGAKKTAVTVKDVASDKFIAAYAELIKRSGKVLLAVSTI